MGILEELAALKEAQPHFVFLDYEGLRAAVESKDPDAALLRLRGELDKVNDVTTVQWEVLSTEVKKQLSKDVPDNLETLENLAKVIVQLHAYVRLSYDALMAAVRSCAQQEETASCAWFASRVENASFRACQFDALLAQLGHLYSAWRKRHGQANEQWLAAQGDSDPLQAFFIPKGNTMLVKVELLKTLAPATRQARITTTSTTTRRVVDVVRSSNYSYDCGRRISQVFFDSARGDQYAERYRRKNLPMSESASERPRTKLVQCSWVNEPERETEVQVTVEDAEGAMSEAHLPHQQMPSLLKGTIDAASVAAKGGGPEEGQQQKAALEAAVQTLREGGLRPSVSASFQRYSYAADAASGSAEVAFVDEDLIFRDEAATAGREWCVAAGAKRAEEEFPGAVLQVRLPEKAAEALLDRLGSLELRPMPGFSPALHATALFHRQLAVPPPPWIPSESLPSAEASSFIVPDPKRPSVVLQEGATAPSPKPASRDSAKKPAASTVESVRRRWRCWPEAAPKPTAKLFVDVKTPMASERTVIRWFRSAVLMASLSGLLMASTNISANINGFLLGLAALVFIAMPTRQFWQRSLEFAAPESKQPKVDRRLPTILSLVLAVILSATLIVDAIGPTSEAGA